MTHAASTKAPSTRRTLLALECALLFGLLPLGLATLRALGGSFPVLLTLGLAALVSWLSLRRSTTFERARLTRWRAPAGTWSQALVRFVVGAALLCAYVLVFERAHWLEFPRRAPRLWLLVMLLYPLLSVLPQELLYRALFLDRYASLWGSERRAALASALAFGWVHVVFLNGLAVALCTLGGYLFARTYQRSASLPCACAEHALYGCLVFTIGLGRHFFAAS